MINLKTNVTAFIQGHNLWMKITALQGYSKILMQSIVTVKWNWTWDINSLRIRDAPGPENGNKPCSKKRTIQSHRAVRRESAMDNRTPNNWSNAIQNVRRSNDMWACKINTCRDGKKNAQEIKHNTFTNIPNWSWVRESLSYTRAECQ